MRLNPQTTKIQRNVTFRQHRQLAPGQIGTTTAHTGQEVSIVQIIARVELSRPFTVLELARQHRLSLEDMEKGLLVTPGSKIRPGSPILEKKRRFRKTIVLESPVEGVVEAVIDGRMLVRRHPQELEIRSLLKGRVVFTEQDQGVTIETNGTRIEGIAGSGSEGHGPFKLLAKSPAEIIDIGTVIEHAQGSVIGLGHLGSPDLIQAAVNHGARGIIVGSVSAAIFESLPKIGIPLTVTDGIGAQGICPLIFETLGGAVGQEMSLLDPAYSNHNRPLIVVSTQSEGSTEAKEIEPKVDIGDRVRLLRAPHSGQTGEVMAVYDYPKGVTQFGSYLPTADVRLASGDVILVPCANLDIIM